MLPLLLCIVLYFCVTSAVCCLLCTVCCAWAVTAAAAAAAATCDSWYSGDDIASNLFSQRSDLEKRKGIRSSSRSETSCGFGSTGLVALLIEGLIASRSASAAGYGSRRRMTERVHP